MFKYQVKISISQNAKDKLKNQCLLIQTISEPAATIFELQSIIQAFKSSPWKFQGDFVISRILINTFFYTYMKIITEKSQKFTEIVANIRFNLRDIICNLIPILFCDFFFGNSRILFSNICAQQQNSRFFFLILRLFYILSLEIY